MFMKCKEENVESSLSAIQLLQLGCNHFFSGYFLSRCTNERISLELHDGGKRDVEIIFSDSSDYLMHLGIELTLKSAIQNNNEKIPRTHDLLTLLKKSKLSLSVQENLALKYINIYAINARYLDKNNQNEMNKYEIEKNFDNVDMLFESIGKFFIILFRKLPRQLQSEFEKIDEYNLCGRSLLQKKI